MGDRTCPSYQNVAKIGHHRRDILDKIQDMVPEEDDGGENPYKGRGFQGISLATLWG